ncbi:hypothetical protein BJY00DRAFT_271361 [Aspergillus carlsbadensis]|nr:hypothetical protein BJY00DRAFT_271361 [Aspergillus carlsbadensis]
MPYIKDRHLTSKLWVHHPRRLNRLLRTGPILKLPLKQRHLSRFSLPGIQTAELLIHLKRHRHPQFPRLSRPPISKLSILQKQHPWCHFPQFKVTIALDGTLVSCWVFYS